MRKPLKTTLAAVLIFYLPFLLVAQQSGGGFDPDNLSVRWEVVENNYEGQGSYLAAFTFTNRSDQSLSGRGWKIYYNGQPPVSAETVSGPFHMTHVNGDLAYIEPGGDFEGLEPGESIRYEYLQNGSIINKTDAPAGLYWVWNTDTDKAFALDDYTVRAVSAEVDLQRGSRDSVPEATPEVIFEENELIQDVAESELTPVFPTPVSHKRLDSDFELTPNTTIAFDPLFEREARLLSKELGALLGGVPALALKGAGERQILLEKSEELKDDEAYCLKVTSDDIVITAGDRAGMFYGIQSLKTLLPARAWGKAQESVSVPGAEIEDKPRFAHRAFMLDVSRNFRTREQVLKTLDLMALYKLNVFHFHFSDDEGWRIEIPGLPELTEVGGRRGHTPDENNHLQPSYGSGPDTDYPGSGSYSREDFIDILRYAKQRHIRVIPEIETPGHARAAIKSMEARYHRLMDEGREEEAEQYLLQHPEDTSEYRSVQSWEDNVMDVALPSTYRFLEKVIDELLAMYEEAGAPLDMIHMGGDEVPAGVWEGSPAVEVLIAEDPEVEGTGDLWYYFFEHVQEILARRGLDLYGWEEVGMTQALWGDEEEPEPAPAFADRNVYLDVWNNVVGGGDEDLAYRLANAGYKVVLSGVSNFYLDMAYEKTFMEPGLYWGGFLHLSKPFSFIPYDYYKNIDRSVMGSELDAGYFKEKERLTDKGRENIVGIQSLLWAERLTDAGRMEYMLLPRLLAMAERAWTPQPDWATEQNPGRSEEQYRQDWSRFVHKISGDELPRLDHYHGGFHYRIPTPGAVIQDGAVHANTQMPGFTIRYTTDGSEPTADSPAYTNPITEQSVIHLKIFNREGRSGRTTVIDNR